VIFKEYSRFFGRNSSGKYALDVGELRIAFTASEALGDRIRRFRDERLSKILSREIPGPIDDGPTIVLHALPMRAFTTRETVDISAKRTVVQSVIYPRNAMQLSARLNLEGIWARTSPHSDPQPEYSLLFRSAIVESVMALQPNERGMIYTGYESDLIHVLNCVLAFYRSSDVGPPAYIFLTLLRAKGTKLQFGQFSPLRSSGESLDRDTIALPEIVIDDFSADPRALLKPMFDMIWNAYGYQRSYNYDENGQWTGKGY
jgi:hypothetical protein